MSDHLTHETALRTVEPAVCLVPVRHLRRFLRHLATQGHAIPQNVDRPWWVERETLGHLTFFNEGVFTNLAPRLLLISDANDRMWDRLPMAEQLRAYWRLLFQAAVLKSLEAAPLNLEQARERLASLGEAVVRELRHVLTVDHFLHPEGDSADLYRAFVLQYLDLQQFAPRSLPDVFPSLPAESLVKAALPAGLDAMRLLRESRPPGALDLDEPRPMDSQKVERRSLFSRSGQADPAGAQKAALKGNHVRAAILYSKSAVDISRAVDEVRELVSHLGDLCGWSLADRNQWTDLLTLMLGPASRGSWSRAARCLYELQKIPTDLRGEIYAVDLAEWLRTLGHRPIRRPLPRTRNVIVLGHLRAAHKQLLRSDIDEALRARLDHLFHEATHETEAKIRVELAPVLAKVIEESGLSPECTVESVARDKIVEELLDGICDRGYLRIGNIRDAIARNPLKMHDLASVREFVRGDSLLRADVQLAYELDGIHRRGEFYLRGIHRFSSIFFGTPWGRWITLYLAIPFGGAFLTLMFAEELRHIGGKAASFFSTLLAPTPTSAPPSDEDELDNEWEWRDETQSSAEDLTRGIVSSSAAHAGGFHGSFLIEPTTVIVFGIFLLLMLHVPPFRRVAFRVLRTIGRGVRLVLYDLPRLVWRSHAGRFLRDNAVVRFIALYLGAPLLLTAIFVGLMAFIGASPPRMLRWGLFFLGAAAIAVNTRHGWLLQDQFFERLSDGWRVLRVNLIPGLIGIILAWFNALANWVERRLYAVDESLRFRSGDSRFSFLAKAVFGLVWFPVAYITRFVFYLLVEPQVNPVKHFPVVTVSHKVIWPMVPQLAEMTGFSVWTVSMVVNGIPGIFGFMAWELKENWRLYCANRSATLRPVVIGSHGETMRRLLRPGFHSGTLPKTYRKLRSAWRRGRSDLVSRGRHEIEHIDEAVHRFAEREMLGLLRTRPEWAGQPLRVKEIRSGCLRLVIVFEIGEAREVSLTFENRDEQIEADFEHDHDLKSLDVERLFSLRDAATGLFNLGAAGLESPWPWKDWVKRWQRVT